MRTLPAPSEPIAAVTSPAATAAALPPDEPPGVCSRDHGLRVCPKPGPLVNGHWPSSQVLVLPTITAPAARSRRTTSASAAAERHRARRAEHGRHARDVDVVLDRDRDARAVEPARPAARLRSASAASASACSVSTTRKALSVGWLASMASSDRRTSSIGRHRPLASW